MAMSAAVLYTLITVTGGGSVGHSRGYESLHMCEEAKSLAMTGQTIEAYKAEDEQVEKAEKERDVAWNKRHPPRAPTASEEKSIKSGVIGYGSSGQYCGSEAQGNRDICGGWHPISGDLVQDDPQPWGVSFGPGYYPDKGESVVYQHRRQVLKYPTDVKTAECVIEPEAQK